MSLNTRSRSPAPRWNLALATPLLFLAVAGRLVATTTEAGSLLYEKLADDSAGSMSSLCANQTQYLRAALRRREDWALKMKDSNGRPGPGVLLHRLLWVGSYDECLSVQAPGSEATLVTPANPGWMSQYCLATVTLQQFPTEDTMIGVCFPDGCDSRDAQIYLEKYGRFPGLDELQLKVKQINHVTCQSREVRWSGATVAVLVFLCLLGAVVGFATVYHVIVVAAGWTGVRKEPVANRPSDLARLLRDGSTGSSNMSEYTMLLQRPITPRQTRSSRTMHHLMTCFSLKSSIKCLMEPSGKYPSRWANDDGHGQGEEQEGDDSPEELPCLHGLRALSMLWVILGNTYYFVGKVPTANLKEAWDKLRTGFFFQAVLNSYLAADIFFLISGTLVCYISLWYVTHKGATINLFRFYFHRFLRTTPSYALVILLMVFVVPHLATGPLWSEVTAFTDKCRSNWWSNLLYVNNLVNTNNMCMDWSWFMANYMQFYLMSPVFIFTIYTYPAAGIFLCSFVIAGSTILTGLIATHNNFELYSTDLSLYTFFKEAYQEQYYMKPYCRAPPFFIGIVVGYILHSTDCQLHLNRVAKIIISSAMVVGDCFLLFGTVGVANGVRIHQSTASFYIAMGHVMWPLSLAWMIVLCCTGNGGFVSRVLSWKMWLPFSRLSWCVYLIHPVVILVHYLSLHTPFFITKLSMTFVFLGNAVISVFAGLVLYVGVDYPLHALDRLFRAHWSLA